MRRAAGVLTAAVLAISAGSAAAQMDRAHAERQESMAGVCAFAPMPPSERLDACNLLLRQPDLSAEARALAHLGRSQSLRQSGEIEASMADLDEAIRLAPDMAPAYLTRGAALLAANDLPGAIRDASRAIELERRSAAGYLLRAEAYLRRGDPAFALGDMDEAIVIAPSTPQLRLIRAYANLALRRPAEAVGDAREALKLAPDMVSGYLVRARAYLAVNAFARAGADAGRAVELAPSDRQAWDAATIAYTELGRFEDALDAADRLIELAPRSADGLNARCWVLALKPDPSAALADCDAAVALDGKHYQAYDSRAFANWQLGRTDAAKADLARAAELAPDFWDWSAREDRFAVVLARRYLKSLGHYEGPIDGAFDDLHVTEDAIRAFQAEVGLAPTGAATAEVLDRLAQKTRTN